ncbi:MAG: tetratricopeptide repeat protein [Rhizomicrobium sp.]
MSGCSSVEEIAQPRASTTEAASFGNYLSARLAASNHDMADAARLYRASLETAPDNADLLNQAFFYSAAAGDVDGAAALAKRVLSLQPDNRAARLTIAVSDMKQGDFAAARSQLAESAKGPFTTLTLSLLDLWAAEASGNEKDVEADLKGITSQGGTDTLANFHRALIFDLQGRNSEAESAYLAALGSGPASPRIAEAYGRFLERAGRTQDARAFYEKMMSDAATSPIAADGLSRLDAGTKPDRLISSPAQGAAEGLFGIAASLSDESSADVAILYLRLSLFLSPDLDLAKVLLADRFETLNKFGDAVAVYRTMGHSSPYWAASSVQSALDQSRLGKNDDAITELRTIVQSNPDDLTAWTALGDAYRGGEKFSEAADAYDHAVRLLSSDQSKDWAVYYARAMAEDQSKHWSAAELDLQHALKLNPEQPQVLNFLGYSWVDQGRNLPEALAMLEKARALSPFDGYIVDSVGWAYYRLGRYDEAAKALQNAVLLVPGDSTINEHLGDAYWKVGRKLDARFQWSHALAFGPEPAQKAELEKKLQSGLDDSAGKH